ncbi:unnamed protein product [Parnassius apollo]|uniref:(apollo) hypothetical protein n=1 Tax=Parnassius apollo TaxID=110799 RepID=A0A8S3WR72_PARAO|nr:unnamed protein product [Parnassius apollo]
MHTPESSPGIMTPRSRTPTPLGTNQVLPRVLSSNHHLSTPQLLNPHESSPGSTTSLAKRGRKQVKRNRTKLFRENQRLKEKIEEINKKYEKYKNRYNRGKQKGSKNKNDDCKSQDKYNILVKAIKKLKSRKEKIAIQKIFEKEVKCSRKKMQIIKECLNVDQGYIRKKQPKLRKKSWRGKGAADGVGGFLKRTADQLVARGQDIAEASIFYSALKDISKIIMHFITDEDINIRSMEIPDNVLLLPGTMKVHQVSLKRKDFSNIET